MLTRSLFGLDLRFCRQLLVKKIRRLFAKIYSNKMSVIILIILGSLSNPLGTIELTKYSFVNSFASLHHILDENILGV
jgi:hypothetical protein